MATGLNSQGSTTDEMFTALSSKIGHLESRTSDLSIGKSADRFGVSVSNQNTSKGVSKASARSRMSRASQRTTVNHKVEVMAPQQHFEFRFSKVAYDHVKEVRGDRRHDAHDLRPSIDLDTSQGLDLDNDLAIEGPEVQAVIDFKVSPQDAPLFVRDVVLYETSRLAPETVSRDRSYVWEPIDQSRHSVTPIFTPVPRRRRRRSTLVKEGSKGSLLLRTRELSKVTATRENSNAALPLPEYDSDEDDCTRALRMRRQRSKMEASLLFNQRKIPGTAFYFNWDSQPGTPATPIIKSLNAFDPVLPGTLPPLSIREELEQRRTRGKKKKRRPLPTLRENMRRRSMARKGLTQRVTSLTLNDSLTLKEDPRTNFDPPKPQSELFGRRQVPSFNRKPPTMVVRRPVRLPPISVQS